MLRFIFAVLSVSALCLAEREYINRIVGGEEADISEFPHQLGLERYDSFKCGASIISTNWALTAAHCIFPNPTAEYYVRAGTTLRELNGDRHAVVKILMHPKYNTNTDDYDFALMQIDGNFDLSGKKPIKVIKMADSGNDPASGQVTVSGWGADVEEIGVPTRHLKKVSLPLVTRKYCADVYGKDDMLITDRMICAERENNDSCQGDSGGPLIMGNVQVGVVSWANGCGLKGYPGVYSRIGNPEVRKWIKDNSGV